MAKAVSVRKRTDEEGWLDASIAVWPVIVIPQQFALLFDLILEIFSCSKLSMARGQRKHNMRVS